MNLKINEHISLGYFTPEDIPWLSEYLNDIDIFNNTLRQPYPYTIADAEKWVSINMDKQLDDAVIENYTIRLNGKIIGGIGFMPCTGFQSHTAEIGYWLAKPNRSQGIMTEVVGFFCKFMFQNHKFIKLIAHTFAHNIGSGLVLEKNGFELEGTLKKHFEKNGDYIDCKLYSILK